MVASLVCGGNEALSNHCANQITLPTRTRGEQGCETQPVFAGAPRRRAHGAQFGEEIDKRYGLQFNGSQGDITVRYAHNFLPPAAETCGEDHLIQLSETKPCNASVWHAAYQRLNVKQVLRGASRTSVAPAMNREHL